jgi:hypothetical protein
MHLTGTMLARPSRMNDRPLYPAPSLISPVRAAEAPAPVEDDLRADDDSGEEIDKYDLSTLACTD